MSINLPQLSQCGDYLPGTEPRRTTNTSNVVVPSIVPNAISPSPPFNVPACPPEEPPIPPPIPPSIPQTPTNLPGIIITPSISIGTTTSNQGNLEFTSTVNGYSQDQLSENIIISNNYQNTPQQTNQIQSQAVQNQVANSSQIATNLQSSVPQRQSITINVDNPSFAGFTSSGDPQTCVSMYNRFYNFLDYPASQNTTFVQNGLYLNIFANTVAEEVAYFLERQSNSLPYWYEKYFNNLTINKVVASLNTNLLTYFNNIHGAGNIQVNPSTFYSMIRQHLVEGTLDEVDVNYYRRVYERQLNDPFINFSEVGETPNTINLAFAIFEQNALNPNYNQPLLPVELQNDFKRMRFLPEDINSYIEVQEIEGNVSQLYANNAGIPVEQLNFVFVQNYNPSSVAFGAGAGYYFSTLSYPTSAIYPLATFNDLSNAYFSQIRDRYNILTLLGADTSYRFTVTSPSDVHEFSSSYNPSADVGPMYLILNMDSVEDIINPNSVITTVSAVYSRVTDEEALAHSQSNGFNLTKLNLDYRDPFVNYVKDTSTITFQCQEFNLRSFESNTTFRNKIMLRNIPQGIILTPGRGSEHNPFNGRSSIVSYDGGKVVRVFAGNASVDISNLEPSKPPIDQERIYFELSTNYLGAYEQFNSPDYHGFVYTYNPSSISFNRSYYSNGEYTNLQPASSLRTNSPEGKFMSLVNSLTEVAVTIRDDFIGTELEGIFGKLTWFDVFTRISSNDIGRLNYSNFGLFRDQLQFGYSNDIPVKFVLNEGQGIITNGIFGEYENQINPPAPIYITESQRWLDFAQTFPGESP